MRHVKRLVTYLRSYRLRFVSSVAAAAFASVLDGLTFALFIPFFRVLFTNDAPFPDTPTVVERLTATLIEGVGPAETVLGPLYTIVALIAVTVLLKNTASYVASYLGVSIEEHVTRDLRTDLYDKLQSIRITAIKRMKAGDLLSRVVSDVDQLKSFISDGLQTVVRNGILIVVYVAILFGLDWRLAVVTMLLALTIAGGMTPLLKKIRVLFARVFQGRGELSSEVLESVTGAHVVKAHGAEAYERTRFRATADRLVADRLHAERYALLASPMSEVFGVTVFVALMVLGMSLDVVDSAVRPEVFVGFAAVTLRLLSPLKKLAHFPTVAEQAGAAAARVFDVLDDERVENTHTSLRTFERFGHAIQFVDVCFAYEPDQWVLQNINLQVERGQVVAIVGPTGAGKSTLIDLVPRFVDPTSGVVRFDGIATTEYAPASLRKAMAIVSQDTVLFNESIRANIAYGDRRLATPDEVERVARAANAHRFIKELPQGYETRIGDRGVRLSGGERQRIAIARALLRDAPILILDEATSALDTQSDRLVQDAIVRLMEDRTVLVIAHRLETISRADRIVVLDRGRIVETGRHGELVAAGGLYQHLSEMTQQGT